MTEEQLRDVLARAVPEPPDGVADPAPVVRRARRRHRVATAVVSGAAVLALAGTALAFQSVRGDDRPDVVEPAPSISDPYSTAPCPPADEPWENGAVADLGDATAVRYCNRPAEAGVTAFVGPVDGLVTDLGAFGEALREIPDADPSRCAAVSVVPTDNRILFQLAEGSVVGVATGWCDDVQVEGRVVDGYSVLKALFAALRAQRDAEVYSASLGAPDVSWCGQHSAFSPALPSSEHLVAATYCGPRSQTKGGTVLDEATVAALDDAWRAAAPVDPEADLECDVPGGSGTFVLARTDRGDVVELSDRGCGRLAYTPGLSNSGISEGTLTFDFDIGDLA